jgi:hypothetical protein
LRTQNHLAAALLNQEKLTEAERLIRRTLASQEKLPGGDPAEYYDTLNNVIRPIKNDYTVYTGHGPETTLFYEFRRNPFFKRPR